MRILIADDETGIRISLSELLKEDHEVMIAKDGEEAWRLMDEHSFDLIISDHQMPKHTGLELLKKTQEVSPLTSFMLMTAFGTVEQAVFAIQNGADDYFLKPFEFPEILYRVNRVMEMRAWRNQKLLKEESSLQTKLIGNSKNIKMAREFITKVAPVKSPVLLLGPSGSGKEVLAQSIHDTSPKKNRPFIPINCASLNEQLMESELFGHEKGAFTGAAQSKPGKFELAEGGTLFLDEIGELPLPIQAKLLRVLQEKEFCRVGGVKQIKTDARVIAATHRPMKEMVEKGLFREDLYFRLNVLSFSIAPLKERKEDLPSLIDFFWNQLSLELNVKLQLSPEVRSALTHYDYPGNIRELRNSIERLMVLSSETGIIKLSELPSEMKSGDENKTKINHHMLPHWEPGSSVTEWIEILESLAIEEAMKLSHDNQVKAAELLKLNRATLQYKLKKYRTRSSDEEAA